MMLYINGDSHTAAAEAVNTYAFAEDDPALFYLGRKPHPANFAVSWGKIFADINKAIFHCDAESASSNARILRTSRDWLSRHQDEAYRTLVIVGWSTWEREEWLHDGTWYQVNASGEDMVPEQLQLRYKQYISEVDWQTKTQQAHDEIWQFHLELMDQKIPHVFFNGNNDFSKIRATRDWGSSYIGPYDPNSTFSATLAQSGFETVSPKSYHFGKEAHRFWAKFMLQYCIENQIIKSQ